jgi:uncharacterized protein (TIGR03067 family)
MVRKLISMPASLTRYFWVMILVGGVVLAARPDFEQPAADDAKLLLGKWRVTSAKFNGGDIFGEIGFLKEKYLRKTTFTFDKEQVVVSVEGLDVEQKAKYRLGPKKSPKQIDFEAVSEGKDLKLKVFRRIKRDEDAKGIYTLDSDKLTLCWRVQHHKNGQPLRPAKFESVFYHLQILVVLEREKKAAD